MKKPLQVALQGLGRSALGEGQARDGFNRVGSGP
jgi:hypothetical protein